MTLKTIIRHNWPAKGCSQHSEDVFDQHSKCAPQLALSILPQLILLDFKVLVAGRRAILRRGDDILETLPEGPQKGILVSVPLFHVTGLTSHSVSGQLASWCPKVFLYFDRCWPL